MMNYKIIQIDRATLDVEVYFAWQDYSSNDKYIIHAFCITQENVTLRDLEQMIESELEGANKTEELYLFQNLLTRLKEEIEDERVIINILWGLFDE